MNNKKLSIYGIGPLYGIIVIVLTVFGIYFSFSFFSGGVVSNSFLIICFVVFGFMFMILGLVLWSLAVFGKDAINSYVSIGKLCTSGIYGIVRNPCYSGVMFLFSGVILLFHNVYLLFLPVLFYIILSVMLKFTEEKWLLSLFGDSYVSYCNRVNRIIPFWRK